MGTRDQFHPTPAREFGDHFPILHGRIPASASQFFVFPRKAAISRRFQTRGTDGAKDAVRRTANAKLAAGNERNNKQRNMKKLFLLMAGLILIPALALAQRGSGSGTSSNDYSFGYYWSNYVNHSYSFDHLWGTNHLALTNAPKAWSNQFSHVYAGKAAAGGGGQVRSQFGGRELPADVQSIVQQFQQDRTKLMIQLKTCSDEQRQLILKDMEQLRTQLREQISKMRDDARQQAEQMRNRFANNRDRILDQGAGNGANGRDR